MLATKFGMGEGGNGSPDYVRGAIEASLERLRTDYVDLFYYHRPDEMTPIAETVGAMHELVEAGKVRAIGVSNVDAAQLREAAAAAPVAVVQNQYSLLERGPRPRCCRSARARRRLRAVLPARERAAHRASTAAASRAAGHAARRPEIDDDTFDRIERSSASPRERGHIAARARDRRARLAARGRLGDRGRDDAGAGPRERGRRLLAADAGRAGFAFPRSALLRLPRVAGQIAKLGRDVSFDREHAHAVASVRRGKG